MITGAAGVSMITGWREKITASSRIRVALRGSSSQNLWQCFADLQFSPAADKQQGRLAPALLLLSTAAISSGSDPL
jgi:hypothetical protein